MTPSQKVAAAETLELVSALLRREEFTVVKVECDESLGSLHSNTVIVRYPDGRQLFVSVSAPKVEGSAK